ncbi:hypothetical protein HBA54_17645 [Pelagibius litoralis]|uniref:Uncharacterized protein n=1 Tax=Pelagibius litoralis TaxID=374515 RepID=A0A967KGK4_9PROT|nr:hypothetical protein [Pelagibius litoralis]NIA70426.1 hypothetical protein [Pelagibius litoralis]
MRPKKRDEKGPGDLFRARFDQIFDMRHERSRLSRWRGRPSETLELHLAESLSVED